MHPTEAKVQTILQSLGVEAKVLHFPEGTRTSQDAADAIGCQVGQIAKAIILVDLLGRHVMVLTSGANRVDMAKIETVLGHEVTKADASIVRDKTGYAIGGVPPVGHLADPVVLMDEDLFTYDVIYAAAGTPHAIFSIAPEDLLRITRAQVADVREERKDGKR